MTTVVVVVAWGDIPEGKESEEAWRNTAYERQKDMFEDILSNNMLFLYHSLLSLSLSKLSTSIWVHDTRLVLPCSWSTARWGSVHHHSHRRSYMNFSQQTRGTSVGSSDGYGVGGGGGYDGGGGGGGDGSQH